MSRTKELYFQKHPERYDEYLESKQRYLDGESLTKICQDNIHLKNRRHLSKMLKEDNIEIRQNGQKYTYKENAFATLSSEEDAYWLGYMYADGNVDALAMRCDLSMAEKDYFHLCKFRDYVSEDLVLIKRKSRIERYGKEYFSYRCYITNKKITENLINLECNWSKTYDVEFPDFIPEELMPHFIRGFFDGDGCVSNSTQAIVNFTGASPQFLLSLQKFVNEKLGMRINKLNKKSKGNAYSIAWGSKKDIKAFYDYIYKDATIYLTRKYNIFNDILGRSKTKTTEVLESLERN